MNEKDVKKMFQDFNVETEDELFNKLDEESRTMICGICGKVIPIGQVCCLGDEIVCRKCKIGGIMYE